MTHTAVRDLRRAHESFQQEQDIMPLIAHIQSIGAPEADSSSGSSQAQSPFSRNDLRLVCFDFICG